MTYVAAALQADCDLISPFANEDRVRAYRASLLREGYYPVAIKRGQKHPLDEGWQNPVQPPPAMLVHPDFLVTGILSAGLRAIDVDIDDDALHDAVVTLARTLMGEGPIRYRTNSNRLLLLYRAAEGQPCKRALAGSSHGKDQSCRIEVLGNGQQFVADGLHPSGGVYGWCEGEPGNGMPLTSLPTVTEAQVTTFLDEAADLLKVERPSVRDRRIEAEYEARSSSVGELGQMSLDDIEAALNVIPYEGYDQWVALAAACAAANPASGHLFGEWFKRGGSDKPLADAMERFHRPLKRISAGTLVHLAREAQPGWVSPSYLTAPKPDPMAALRERLAERWDRAHGQAEAKADEAKPDDVQPKKQARFRMYRLEEIADLPPVEWLVPTLLPKAYFATLYGASRAFKSFIALDMALCIGSGTPFHGREVQKASVIYIAPEGFSGINQRIEAWCRHHKIARSAIDVRVIEAGVNLMSKQDIVDLALGFEIEGVRPALVIFDTLARSMAGGDEQAAKDFNIVTAHAGMLRETFGSTVMLVHHAGKDASRGARGSYAIKANSDAMFEVTRKDGSLVTRLKVEKLKDSADDWEIEFEGKAVEWLDPRHGPQASLVFVEYDPAPAAKRSNIVDERDRKKLVEVLGSEGGEMTLAKARLLLNLQKSGTAYEKLRRLIPEEGVEVEGKVLVRTGKTIVLREPEVIA